MLLAIDSNVGLQDGGTWSGGVQLVARRDSRRTWDGGAPAQIDFVVVLHGWHLRDARVGILFVQRCLRCSSPAVHCAHVACFRARVFPLLSVHAGFSLKDSHPWTSRWIETVHPSVVPVVFASECIQWICLCPNRGHVCLAAVGQPDCWPISVSSVERPTGPETLSSRDSPCETETVPKCLKKCHDHFPASSCEHLAPVQPAEPRIIDLEA